MIDVDIICGGLLIDKYPPPLENLFQIYCVFFPCLANHLCWWFFANLFLSSIVRRHPLFPNELLICIWSTNLCSNCLKLFSELESKTSMCCSRNSKLSWCNYSSLRNNSFVIYNQTVTQKKIKLYKIFYINIVWGLPPSVLSFSGFFFFAFLFGVILSSPTMRRSHHIGVNASTV